MRSAFPKLALIFILFIPAMVLCQINPNTQINWPQPACGNASAAWMPGAGTCATVSGGPGGGLPVNNPQYTGTMIGPNMSITSANFNSINGWGVTASTFAGATPGDQILAACN